MFRISKTNILEKNVIISCDEKTNKKIKWFKAKRSGLVLK
jgi:hypothetical protein